MHNNKHVTLIHFLTINRRGSIILIIISDFKMAGSSHDEFISKSAFKRLCQRNKEEKRDVKKWTELTTDGTVYKIINSEKKQGKFGDCYILTIKDKSGEESKVWAPKALQKEVEEEAQKIKT